MENVISLPERVLPAKLTLSRALTDDQYYDFCMASPDVWFERTEQGEIVIVPPAGAESDHRNAEVIVQLGAWAKRDGRGKAFGATAQFILPTGAALSPDAAWVSNARLSQLSNDQKRKFPKLVPEFIMEIKSPSDRLKSAREKMELWIRGGVELAWLIDGDKQSVFIYRVGSDPEQRSGITKLAGEGPVQGFELDLEETWAGL